MHLEKCMKWYIQSYVKDKEEKNYFTDEFGLAKKYPALFLSGPSRGDITKRKSIEYYYSFFQNKKRDIVTSDCGLGSAEVWETEKGYGREKQMMKIFFLFERVNLIKPESSRQPGGKEIYILCKNLKEEIDDKFKSKLLDILQDFTEDDLKKSIMSSSVIDKEILKDIDNYLTFLKWIWLVLIFLKIQTNTLKLKTN